MDFWESEFAELKATLVEEIKKEIMASVRKETDGDSFETMRSSEQALTFEEVKKVFARMDLKLGETEMKTLGLLDEENEFTNLALLLSDQCPHIIKGATFRGTDQTEFQDRREFGGSLLKQLNDAYEWLDLRNNLKAEFAGLYRTDRRDYDEFVLREALINAIVHREYSFQASTLVSVYQDRVEIISYGGISGHAELEDVLMGLSVCRNPKLANIFYRLQFIEAYGTGLIRIQDAYSGKAVQPKFAAGPNSFKVVLPNNNIVKKTQEKVTYNGKTDDVLMYLEEQGEVSRNDIEKYLGISASSAVRLMRMLKEEGLISTTGKGKNTRYTKE